MTTTSELENKEVEVDPALAVQIDGKSASAPDAIAAAMGQAFTTLHDVVQRHSLVPTGAPRAIYSTFGPQETSFTVAMPVASVPALKAPDGVRVDTLRGGRALRFVHHGSYRTLAETYQRIEQWLRARGGIKTAADWQRYAPMWEEYVTDVTTTPEEDLLTYIYLPLGWTGAN